MSHALFVKHLTETWTLEFLDSTLDPGKKTNDYDPSRVPDRSGRSLPRSLVVRTHHNQAGSQKRDRGRGGKSGPLRVERRGDPRRTSPPERLVLSPCGTRTDLDLVSVSRRKGEVFYLIRRYLSLSSPHYFLVFRLTRHGVVCPKYRTKTGILSVSCTVQWTRQTRNERSLRFSRSLGTEGLPGYFRDPNIFILVTQDGRLRRQ